MLIIEVSKFTISSNEIYQLDFLKEVILNPSMKEAVTCRRAPCQKFFISLKSVKTEMVKQIALSANGSYQLAFLKEVVLNHPTKGEINVSFRKAPCSLPSISKKSAKLKCLRKN